MINVRQILARSSLMAALACFSGLLLAQAPEGQGGPRKPPQEALDACKSLSAGQECGFTSPQGSVKGSCWAPEDKPLACKPKDEPSRGSQAKNQ